MSPLTTARLILKIKNASARRVTVTRLRTFTFRKKTSLYVRTIAIPSQNETKLVLLLSVVIVLLLTIPVSSSKTDRADFIARSFFIRFGAANRRFTVDDGAPEQWKQISYCAPRHGDAFCRKFIKRKGVGQNANPSLRSLQIRSVSPNATLFEY